MSRDITSKPGRCLLVGAVVTVAAALLEAWLVLQLPATVRGGSRPGFEQVLVTGCGIAAAGCVAWLWILVTFVVGEALRGRAGRAGTGVPPVVRRVVLAACGLSVAGGLLAPANAVEHDPVAAAPGQVLVGLPLPDRMTTAQWLGAVAEEARRLPVATGHATRPARTTTAVVRPGESLWRIARRTLPVGADDATVDRRWRLIYRVNRGLIGPDPDLLLPGQHLRLPPRHSPR